MSTERPDPAAHLDGDALADLQEGLLDAAGEAEARRHLEACPLCRADLAVLTSLPARLAAVADVGPVPLEVAARIDSALAEATTADPPAEATSATRTVTPLPLAKPTPVRGMRLLQAAAVLVLVLGAGAIGMSALTQGGGDSGGTASTAGDVAGGKVAPERAEAPVTASGRDWTPSTLEAAAPRLATGAIGPTVTLFDRQAGPAAGSDSSGGEAGSPPTPADGAAGAAAARWPTLRPCVPAPPT